MTVRNTSASAHTFITIQFISIAFTIDLSPGALQRQRQPAGFQ